MNDRVRCGVEVSLLRASIFSRSTKNNLFGLEGAIPCAAGVELFLSPSPSLSLALSLSPFLIRYASARLIRVREANQRRERDRESSHAYASQAA